MSMSKSLTRRLEKLEEVVERERAEKVPFTWYWINRETGEMIDSCKPGGFGG
jgi:hypothetical protein